MINLRKLHRDIPPDRGFGIIYKDNIVDAKSFESVNNFNSLNNSEEINKSIYSAAILVYKSSLVKIENSDYYKFNTVQFGVHYHMCRKSKFYKSPAVVGCLGTCFAIAENLIVTSQHVIRDQEMDDLCAVFNYNNLHGNYQIHINNIFYINQIQKNTVENNDYDFVILKIKENESTKKFIPDGNVANFETNYTHYKKWKIFMAGYPRGLPLQICTEAKIYKKKIYYITDLDAFQLNSGSPVFNQNYKVIGILDNATKDIDEKKCNKINVDYRINLKNAANVLPIEHIIHKL